MFLSWCCIHLFVFRTPVVKVIQHRENEKWRVYLLQDKRPSSTVTMVLQIKKMYRVDICDRNTSSIACNEHIQTMLGQKKCKNLSIGPMSNLCYGPKMGR